MTWIIVAFTIGVIVGAVGGNLILQWVFEREIGRVFGWW